MSEVVFRRLEDIRPTQDWRKRLDALKDVTIDYSDIPQLDDNFPKEAVRGLFYQRGYRPIQGTPKIAEKTNVPLPLKIFV